MATQVSPGILVQEVDKTLAVPQIQPPTGALAGNFSWGPVEQVTTLTGEDELVAKFGKPNSNTADYFFTAANFLSYSNALRVVRVVNANTGKSATASYNSASLPGAFTLDTANTQVTIVSGNANSFFAGQTVYVANATHNAQVTVLSANDTTVTLVAVPSSNVTSGNAYAYGVYLKNDTDYEENFSDGTKTVGVWSAKWIGSLGNSLRVEMCASANAFSQAAINATHGVANTTLDVNTSAQTVVVSGNVASYVQVGDLLTVGTEVRQVTAVASNGTQLTVNSVFTVTNSAAAWSRKWKYASLFGTAPSTSTFAAQLGGSKDELHVVVVDEDGQFTGTANTVVEKFGFLSKASNAKDDVGNNIYYKNAINNRSAYVWWLAHPSGVSGWGQEAAGVTFSEPNLLHTASLSGGNDGVTVSTADLTRGYDMFVDEGVEVDMILGASASSTLANYIISSVVLKKKYTMGFFSPSRADVVNKAGLEVSNVLTYRDALPSTSYAVLDSGWKYQYDKYNDVYRYVPLNGDTAGCLVRTSQDSESWFSPAGFTRGQIKNVVKLAFNPKQVDRDDLYVKGVNPVVSFPGQGTVLFGDKTLQNKPTAFDRINVRRLFIVLEKSIERAAQQLLFEQNDEFTRNQFVNLVEPFLRQVKGRRGISDFLVVCDETNNPPDAVDRNEFRADVYVKPIRSINFIQLNVVAVRSDVAFNEIITNLQ